jgi:hypothetical protein
MPMAQQQQKVVKTVTVRRPARAFIEKNGTTSIDSEHYNCDRPTPFNNLLFHQFYETSFSVLFHDAI